MLRGQAVIGPNTGLAHSLPHHPVSCLTRAFASLRVALRAQFGSFTMLIPETEFRSSGLAASSPNLQSPHPHSQLGMVAQACSLVSGGQVRASPWTTQQVPGDHRLQRKSHSQNTQREKRRQGKKGGEKKGK